MDCREYGGVGGRQTAIECLTSKYGRVIERGTYEKLLNKDGDG